MITTRYGEKIDFADENLEYDGKNYNFRDLSILKNIYEQITTAEFLMENYKLSEDRAWVTAGLVREKMDKNELSEEAAIEETMAESQIMDGFDLASIVKKTKIAPQELYELTNYYKKMK